jgi:DNA-binding MarR family transcriptional regulator
MGDRCICSTLRLATRAITKLYGDHLAPAGVNAPQFAQLEALSRLGQATIGKLAAETDLDRSTLGRNVRVLERMGLVELGPGDDERTRVLSLTKTGQRTLARATPLWASVQDAVTMRLGPRRTEQLLDLLGSLADARQ